MCACGMCALCNLATLYILPTNYLFTRDREAFHNLCDMDELFGLYAGRLIDVAVQGFHAGGYGRVCFLQQRVVLVFLGAVFAQFLKRDMKNMNQCI